MVPSIALFISCIMMVMDLYWKDIEIRPGMFIEVKENDYLIINAEGRYAQVVWEILKLDSRKNNDAYYDTDSGKSYSMMKVMKNRRLQAKLDRGSIIQIPACTDFLLVQEYHDGTPACKRCYSLDMLANINEFRIIGDPGK